MKLVEAEAVGPVEGEEAVVTPPRPPHRRVSVSLIFTLTVLIGTVVAIFLVFPARGDTVLAAAIQQHRQSTEPWDLANPSPAETRAWAYGVVGAGAPLPSLEAPVQIIGVRRVELLDRPAAVVRLRVGDDPMTYVVQSSQGQGQKPAHSERDDGDLHAIAWQSGDFVAAAVGQAATRDRWLKLVR